LDRHGRRANHGIMLGMSDTSEMIAALDAALEQVETEMEAEECHGTLTGLFCAKGELTPEEWLGYIGHYLDPNDLLAKAALDTFGKLYEQTRQGLNDSTLDFHPLLLGDEASVEERIESLGQWCQGFLLGLSAGGVTELDKMPGDSGEILRDLVEIARAGSYELEGGEEDENSFLQLLEYVRTGILLINEELHPTKAPPRSDVTVH
jgi:yecA family protein